MLLECTQWKDSRRTTDALCISFTLLKRNIQRCVMQAYAASPSLLVMKILCDQTWAFDGLLKLQNAFCSHCVPYLFVKERAWMNKRG